MDANPRLESLEERLEGGELLHFPACPFPLPHGHDRAFLFEQRLSSSIHKNISYDPGADAVFGFAGGDATYEQRLKRIFADFSTQATGWLSRVLPRYAGSWQLDRVSFRPDEEATRRLRLKARNDLLHTDAFPSRPTQGCRILRLYVNLSPDEPRVWATAEGFAALLAKYGQRAGLPGQQVVGWAKRLRQGLLGLFNSRHRVRSDYDWFMLRFHDFLKTCDEFQERASRRYWSFAPGAAWLLFSDGLSHADLRGRHELDHSYFVALDALARPETAPASLLEKACGLPVCRHAA
jgi:3-deoxy-D-manno-octulosonic acid hydroxylase-like protein